MNRYQWIVASFCIAGILSGCGTGRVQTAPEEPLQKPSIAEPVSIQTARPGHDLQRDVPGDGDFELVETPFGLIRRPKKKPGISAEPGVPFKSAPAIETPGSGATVSAAKPPRDLLVAKTGDPLAPPSQGKPGDIVLNFDNADLFEVIRTFAELLDFNYILDGGVTGTVTIQTTRGIHRNDLWPIFFQILEINGLTAVQEDHLFKIAPIKDVSRLPLRYHTGRQAPDAFPSERTMIQIIPLEYIQAPEMATLVKPFISANGTLITHDKTNTLIIVDKGSAIVKALKLIEVFDIDLFKQVRHRFFQFNYVQADDMQKLLTEILTGYDSGMKQGLKMVPIERLNTLLVISNTASMMGIIEGFIRQLDVPSADIEARIYVYPVQNARAEDLGGVLESIFNTTAAKEKQLSPTTKGAAAAKEDASTGARPNPLIKPSQPAAAPTESTTAPTAAARIPAAVGGDTGGAKTLTGELKITTDPVRNTLIFQATPSDYRIIEDILKKLDVMPRQVLIDVLIAEISLDDSSELGVEWSYLKDNSLLDTTVQLGSSGLQYAKNLSDKWAVTISALASQNKVKVISAPSIMASDNTAASINISTEIPVASAQYEYNTSGGVTSTSIQYRNTGIILSVTPHINERGLVSMEISQEVSNVASGVTVAGKEYPSFRQRSVSTTLTVGHRQTIVIGGLIQENKDDTESGLPLLSKIPLLKYLVGQHKKTVSRTELVLSITPHVIVNLEDVDAVTNDFKKKISL